MLTTSRIWRTAHLAVFVGAVLTCSGALAQVDGDLRIVDGSNDSEGTLEFYYEGHWGLVCHDYWDLTDAGVACRQLGFAGATGATLNNAFGTDNDDQRMLLDDVACAGTEATLLSCPRSAAPIGRTNCGRRETAGVVCQGTIDPLLDITLSKTELTLTEADLTGETYTVVLDAEPDADVTIGVIVPSQSEIEASPSSLTFTTESWDAPQTVTLTAGVDTSTSDLSYYVSHEWTGQGRLPPTVSVRVRHSNPVTVWFSGFPEDGHPGEPFTFRLRFSEAFPVTEAAIRASLTVTDATLTTVAPAVAGETQAWDVTVTPDGADDVWVSMAETTDCTAENAICTADNRRLAQERSYRVRYAAPPPPLPPVNQDVLDPNTGTLRLSNGSVPSEGDLEFYYDNEWGLVCHDYWDINDAQVACRQLGYARAIEATKNTTFRTDNDNQSMVVDDVECTGIEQTLLACPRRNDAELGRTNCGRREVAGARCEGVLSPSAAITVSETELTLTEGSQTGVAYTVVLDAEPAESVTLTMSAPDGAPITATPASVTFTTDNWATVQTITLTAGPDDDRDNETYYVVHRLGDEGTVPPAIKVRVREARRLTATFSGAPAEGHGDQAFTFALTFSEAFPVTADALRGAVAVTGGTLTTVAAASADDTQVWNLTVTPEAGEEVTVTLAATTDCDASGALCTADDRPLSAAVSVTVADALTPLTAAFSGVPATHSGSEFTLELAFSEAPSLSYRRLIGTDGHAAAITVDGGSLRRAERIVQGENQRWRLFVVPVETADVTVTLGATSDCAAAGAICTEDTRPLSAAVVASIPRETVEVPPPTLFTVRFDEMPAEHDGDAEVVFKVHFSEEPDGYSFRTLRDHTLDVRQGTSAITPHVRRLDTTSNAGWRVSVEPVSRADLVVSVSPTTDCEASDAVCTADDRPLSNALSATVPGPPALAVADATVREAAGATMDFAVSLSRASTSTVSADYATSDGTATAGSDYTAANGTLTFSPGETEKTVSVPVLDDAIDDGGETFTLTLSNVSGGNAWLEDATGTGTIENTGEMPEAWLVRFGRTVAAQAVDAVGARLEGEPGSHARVGGRSLSGDAMTPEQREALESALHAFAGSGDGSDAMTHSMTGRELLLGSSFQLSAGGDAAGPAFTAWGRVATGGFDAEVDGTRLDGSATTGFLGADMGGERWLAGLAVSLTEGDGDYAQGEGDRDRGDVESSLTAFYPYARLGLTETVDAWGLAGFGEGELTLTQHANDNRAEARYTTDISMRMAALGVRGEVLSPSAPGGLAIAVKSDALWVRTESEAVTGLNASDADASRLRLLVEGARRFETGGGTLTPALELGLRHDDGDAETGAGIEAGASLRYQGGRLSIEGAVRTLVAHERSDYGEWGASGAVRIDPGASGRGLSLSVAPSWGGASRGTDRLWSAGDARALAPGREPEAGGQLDAELGYGLGLSSAPGVLTPYAGLSLGDGGAWSWRGGGRWALAPGASLSFEGTRREAGSDDAASGHELMLRGRLRW